MLPAAAAAVGDADGDTAALAAPVAAAGDVLAASFAPHAARNAPIPASAVACMNARRVIGAGTPSRSSFNNTYPWASSPTDLRTAQRREPNQRHGGQEHDRADHVDLRRQGVLLDAPDPERERVRRPRDEVRDNEIVDRE